MKNDLIKARKRMLIRVLLLTALCLLVAFGGRMTDRREFQLRHQFDEGRLPEKTQEVHIAWETGELPVERMDMRNTDKLMIAFKPPHEQGKYALTVTDRDGEVLFRDELHIGPMGTVYSSETGNFTGDNALIAAISLFFIGLAAIGFIQFFSLKGPLMYSYDAILSLGIGLFCTVTGFNMLGLFLRRMLNSYRFGMRDVYEQLCLSGGTFLKVSSPVILVFSLLMIISNIALLRHERFRLKNVLGLAIALALILGEALGFWLLGLKIPEMAGKSRLYYTASSVYGTLVTYFECILMSSAICAFRAARHIPAREQDYILILGCSFRKDGTLFPLLKGRVDKAVEFWKKQKEETGKMAVLVPSGGQGSDESMPEAEAMSRYLKTCGIPDSAIMPEKKSRNTFENMAFSREMIRAEGGREEQKKVIFVTTNYHVFRSGVWASLAGLCAEGLGSRTKWWFWPNAFMRECIGLFANRIWTELLWLGLAIGFFALLAMPITS